MADGHAQQDDEENGKDGSKHAEAYTGGGQGVAVPVCSANCCIAAIWHVGFYEICQLWNIRRLPIVKYYDAASQHKQEILRCSSMLPSGKICYVKGMI
jgi:hypothetical protein